MVRFLMDWAAKRALGDLKALAEKIDDNGDQVELKLELNPVRDYLRVTGDFINYDKRAEIEKCRASVVDGAGKELAGLDLKIDGNAYVKGIIRLPDLPIGPYTAKLACLDKDGGKILTRESAFEKKDCAKEFPVVEDQGGGYREGHRSLDACHLQGWRAWRVGQVHASRSGRAAPSGSYRRAESFSRSRADSWRRWETARPLRRDSQSLKRSGRPTTGSRWRRRATPETFGLTAWSPPSSTACTKSR